VYLAFQLFALVTSALAVGNACEGISTYVEFYQCTLQRHPRLAIAQEKIKEAEAVYDKASQWRNPDFAVKSVGGSLAGERVASTELTLLVPMAQFWTRGPQKGVASARRVVVEVEAKEALVDFKEELIKELYRLRQIEDDLELLNETLSAFSTILGQFRSRKARGPDQEVTLNLVELATSEYQLKRNHVQIERAEIHAKLKALWGKDFEIKKSYLPPLRQNWPEVNLAPGVSQSLAVQKAMAETERALAEQSLASLESLPSLRVGPVMARELAGPSRTWSYGLALEASLPLFSWSGGVRAEARSKANQAELGSAYVVKKFDFEKDILLQKYQSAVESLARSSSRDDLRRKHHRVDSFFRQGLASGALVIEAHRLIVEYQQSQHEHENAAIDAYIDLMTLTGGEVEGIMK
jgi:outer membrane protein TolC